jgi:uncharacterized protein involved in outer membrane biogenesis
MIRRFLTWFLILLLALPLLAVLYVTIFGWNWARAPLQRIVTEKTGRQLVIGGDLQVKWAWPAPRVHAHAVTFANPTWAKEKQMLAVDDVEFTVELRDLLKKHLMFPEVRLTHPVVFLEQAADGRKTWLLDLKQSDESARIPIGRLALDQGRLGYDDANQTSIRADISTQDARADAIGVVFSATGLYKGQALKAHGNGGSVLALHDESVPYPLKVDASFGRTGIKADGTVTSLLKFSAMDMHLTLHGDSLAQLFPLFGIALPKTPPYATSGRLVHSGKMWRYEKFSGHLGKSDIAGTLEIDKGGARPFMKGELNSQLLDLADLGPLIGAKKQPVVAAKVVVADVKAKPLPPSVPTATAERVLPDIPFNTERWDSVDADVTLRAKSILRAKQLPLENLVTHLKMQNSVLTLDPLDFGFAGGHLNAVITMNGRENPIQARAKIGVRKVLLAKLFPTVKLSKASIGQLNGEFDLTGKGNSVGKMLATSNGRASLIVADGEISKLLMEEVGLHLVEILQLKLTGDKTIKLNCAVADFGVKTGVMNVNALVLDTDVSTITGDGSVNLGQETLNLVLSPKTRNTSLVALRTPIYVTGTFSKPQVELDKARIAARGIGAVALGLVNPLLALLPLVETGPGLESECGRLIQQAKAPLPKTLGQKGSKK